MPLHNPTATAVRMPRFGRLTAIAVAAAATAGAVTIAVTEEGPGPQLRTIEAVQPAGSRYFDIEANKAASMRAHGRQIAGQHTGHPSLYQDIEANKARSQGAR